VQQTILDCDSNQAAQLTTQAEITINRTTSLYRNQFSIALAIECSK